MFAEKILENVNSDSFLIHQDDLLNFTFDRNEDFCGPFREFVIGEKKKLEISAECSIWKLVDGVGEGEMKYTPGIQAADILAWATNRENTSTEGEDGKYIAYLLHQVVMSTAKEYDRKTLLHEFGQSLPNSYL